VIQTVNFRLEFQQQLGIAHVFPQPGRHGGRILEQARKDGAVASDDRIIVIKDIKGGRAIVASTTTLTLLRM